MLAKRTSPQSVHGHDRSDTSTSTELHQYYRALCRQMMRQPTSASPTCRVVGVTSCQRSAGVSTVVANLGVCLAQELKQPVLLLDANLDRPSLRRAFGLLDPYGLSDLLSNGDDPLSYAQATSITNLSVLAAGLPRDRAAVSFSPGRFSQLLEALRNKYAFVLIDLPEVNETSYSTAIASLLDGVLFVIESEKTPRDDARRAAQRLTQFGAAVLGVVLNKQAM